MELHEVNCNNYPQVISKMLRYHFYMSLILTSELIKLKYLIVSTNVFVEITKLPYFNSQLNQELSTN